MFLGQRHGHKSEILWIGYMEFYPVLKLQCHNFIDSDRAPKTPGSQTKDFITHGRERSLSFMCTMVIPVPPNPLVGIWRRNMKEAQVDIMHAMAFVTIKGGWELETPTLQGVAMKPNLYLEGRHYLYMLVRRTSIVPLIRGLKMFWFEHYTGPSILLKVFSKWRYTCNHGYI